MLNISVCRDLQEAKRIWQLHWPQTCIFDLWPVRECFHSAFDHPLYFLVAARDGRFCGMLALSWIHEARYYAHFPGEIWQGKTWLEQNKILADDPDVLQALLDHLPEPATIRYLTQAPGMRGEAEAMVDEVGYLFFPKAYDYSFSAYMEGFSGKSRKKIRQELDRLKAGGVTFRYDCASDIDLLFRLNLDAFKEHSYFHDERFLKSFENLAAWLHANNLLRITTVLIGNRVAAVDIGAVWNSTYTVLAGGTHVDFPGVAKLINFHHIEWACRQRIAQIDFLCGDFHWKERFHLTPRPLFKIQRSAARQGWQGGIINREAVCAG